MPTPPEIEALLAEDGWIRRLARSLVPDPHLADDLAQEAWVAALKHPDGAHSLRPWLGGVLRNVLRSNARSRGRREARERAAARDEALPSAAELVEEVTLRREVADHLLELEEPYRTTLYLRFFRDLSLKKVAQRTGVPLSTAHARLQRGLEKMRRRMDRAHGGDRRSWSLAMLSLARPAGGLVTTTLATPLGGIAMSTGLKVAATLVVAGGALGIYLQTRGSGTDEPPAAVPDVAQAAPGDAAPPVELAPPASGTREALAAAPGELVEPPPEPAAPELMALQGRVIDTSRAPVPGIEVGFVLDGATEPIVSTHANTAGRFSLERPLPRRELGVSLDPLFELIDGGMLVVQDALFATLAIGVVGHAELVVVVEPRADFAGAVVDASGAPLEDAQVAVRVRQGLYRELGLSQFMSMESGSWSVRTDEAGEFLVADACGGEHVFLDVQKPGFASREVDLPAQGALDMVVVLERLDDSIDVTGRVIDAGGAPVEGAKVSMGHAIELTDADGRFTIRWSAQEAGEHAGFAKRADGVWVAESVPLHIAAVKPGLLPAWLDLEDADLSTPLVLQLGPAPLSIAGRVVDDEDRPLAGVVVWETNPRRFGRQSYQQGENASWLTTTVEEELRGGFGNRGVKTDAEGRFELGGLMRGRYGLQVYDPATASAGAGWEIEAGSADVTLVLPADPSLARVAGRVVSAGGAPLPGVEITPQRAGLWSVANAYQGPPDRLLESVTSDAEGRFELPRLATEGTTLQLFGERIFFRFVSLADHEDPSSLEIVEPVLCELQVELTGDADPATRVEILDGKGEPLEILQSFGVYLTQGMGADLEEGRSGVLKVAETARTLVLYAGERELARRPLALDPDRRAVVRP